MTTLETEHNYQNNPSPVESLHETSLIWDTSYQIGLQNLNLLKLQLELD
jgi:hypothetical protein